MGAPSPGMARSCAGPERAMGGVAGRARANVARSCTRTLGAMRGWLLRAWGPAARDDRARRRMRE
eukprot:4667022-Pyramimonas_sp.AAC.1